MALEKAPAYQWYPKDYETDEAVMLMTYEQEGIYRRLLDHQALHGSIPDDPSAIASLCPKVSRARFLAKVWPAVQVKFNRRVGPGRLVNPKLYGVLEQRRAYIEEARAAGKRSGEARKTGQSASTEHEGSGRVGHRVGPTEEATEHKAPSLNPPRVEATEEPTEPQRKANSSTPSPSSTPTPEKRVSHTAPRGATIFGNEHRAHAACGRVCVPAFLHRQFITALGGPEPIADQRLRDWYQAVLEALNAVDDTAVDPDGVAFWRPRFRGQFVTPGKLTLNEAAEHPEIAKLKAELAAEATNATR